MTVNRNSSSRPFMAAIAVLAVLSSGCSWFHQRADYYNKAGEGRPLEVPPDLDTPVTTSELSVPAAGASAASKTPASSVTTVPAAAPIAASSASVSTMPPASAANLSGSDLRISDSVPNTWQRVGLALERAQIGAVSARDETAHTYTLDFNSTVEVGDPEHHWYSRVLHPFSGSGSKTQQVTGHLTVRVSDDTGGSRVSVEGNPSDKNAGDSARRVIEVLRERLS